MTESANDRAARLADRLVVVDGVIAVGHTHRSGSSVATSEARGNINFGAAEVNIFAAGCFVRLAVLELKVENVTEALALAERERFEGKALIALANNESGWLAVTGWRTLGEDGRAILAAERTERARLAAIRARLEAAKAASIEDAARVLDGLDFSRVLSTRLKGLMARKSWDRRGHSVRAEARAELVAILVAAAIDHRIAEEAVDRFLG